MRENPKRNKDLEGDRVFLDITEAIRSKHQQLHIRGKSFRKCGICHEDIPEADFRAHREECVAYVQDHPPTTNRPKPPRRPITVAVQPRAPTPKLRQPIIRMTRCSLCRCP